MKVQKFTHLYNNRQINIAKPLLGFCLFCFRALGCVTLVALGNEVKFAFLLLHPQRKYWEVAEIFKRKQRLCSCIFF